MKRSFKSTLIVALTLLALFTSALGVTPALAAKPVIIESVPGANSESVFISVDIMGAVAFTMPDTSYQISDVSMDLASSVSNVPLITIQGDNAGFPDGTPVATFDNPAGGVGSQGTYVFTLASPVTLNASTKYWLVADASSGEFIWYGYSDGSYSGLASWSGSANKPYSSGWMSNTVAFTFALTGPETDTTAPTVTNVFSDTPDGFFMDGQAISVKVLFSEAVDVDT
ncbi:MAG: hypothetical protein EHM81_14120, partial [Chloroflexi bacterium]